MYLQADRAITFPVIMGLAQKRICLACRPSNFAGKMPMKLVMYSTITVPIEPVQYSWAEKPKTNNTFRPSFLGLLLAAILTEGATTLFKVCA